MELPNLPNGYRLLRTAPGVWVLVELYSTGRVVARYEGDLNPGKVEHDARQHAGSDNTDDMYSRD
jgi:hypothetical protein